jgi:hypothetical protein
MWERLSIGKGGWVCFESSEIPATVYVRFEDRDGRLAACDLFLADESNGSPDLGANLLRTITLGRIEAWALADHEFMRATLMQPGPDLRRAAAHYAYGPNVGSPHRPDNWVARMIYAQIPGSGIDQVPMPRRRPPPKMPPSPDATLTVPTARPYGDDFYRQVARVYSALAQFERAPASAIADANSVPVTTVHRWVKQARARVFLPRGHPGKAG